MNRNPNKIISLNWIRLTESPIQHLLCRYGTPGVKNTFSVLPSGITNLNLRCSAAGRLSVLRVYRYRSPRRVQDEIEILAYLARKGFPVAKPRSDQTGQTIQHLSGHSAVLFEFIKGVQLKNDSLGPIHLREIGKWVGKLHTQGRLASIGNRRWRGDLRGIKKLLGDQYAELSARGGKLFHASWPCLQELSEIKERSRLPRGIIHADIRAENLVFSKHKKLSGLLDFDNFYRGFLLTDLVTAVYFLCYRANKLDPARTKKLVSSYRSYRTITRAEIEAGSDFLKFVILKNILFGLLIYKQGNKTFGEQAIRDGLKRWYSLPAKCDWLYGTT